MEVQNGQAAAIPLQRAGAGISPFDPQLSEPLDLRLLTLGASRSFYRRGRSDLYVGASVGRIELGKKPSSGTPLRDLVTGVGGGALVHLWRIVFLRGDLRVHTQWCSEERGARAVVCDGGEVLHHLEASGGVQLVFHPYASEGRSSETEEGN